MKEANNPSPSGFSGMELWSWGQAGSGLGPHEVYMLPGKLSPSRHVFPVPLSVRPLLTLGTMLLCVETFCDGPREEERESWSG